MADTGDGDTSAPPQREFISIPGDAFYPEGVAFAHSNDSAYVGSLSGGDIYRALKNETAASPFIANTPSPSAVGMILNFDESILWVCGSDTNRAVEPAIYGYETVDGNLTNSHAFGGAGFCNDLAFDDARNLYATDSTSHRIVRVRGQRPEFSDDLRSLQHRRGLGRRGTTRPLPRPGPRRARPAVQDREGEVGFELTHTADGASTASGLGPNARSAGDAGVKSVLRPRP